MTNELIYIMSPSYSGSTLLTFLLANHPAIATIGELKASALGDIDKYTCSCGEQILTCEFWQRVIAEMTKRGYSFSLDEFGTHLRFKGAQFLDRLIRANVRGQFFESARSAALHLVPGCQSRLEGVLLQNKALIEVIKYIQEAKFFLDGSKDPVRLKHFQDSGLWNIKVISLVRDGRGVANSYMNHVGVSMEIAAKEWWKKCKEMENVKAFVPEANVFELKYEDLCMDTSGSLIAILQFAGLNINEMPEVYHSDSQHILGNSMRLKTLDEIRLDEKWRRMLSEEDLTMFYKVTGNMNEKLGYLN